MRRTFLVLLTLCLAANLRAAHGVVYTVDGQRLEGEIAFGHGEFVIKIGDARSITVPATNLAHVQMAMDVEVAQSQGSGNGLLGIYYATTNFTGPATMRLDSAVNGDWRLESPGLGLPADGFSVRWMTQLEAPTTERYTIHFDSDDGARIFLDDKLVVENWKSREFTEASFTANLIAGERRNLRIDYADFSGNASAHLWWSTASMPRAIIPQGRLHAMSCDAEHRVNNASLAGVQGLLATYFNSENFTSNSFTRIDSEINFDWDQSSPAEGIENKCFSVRWLGNLLVTNDGEYKFYIIGGLPARLFINGQLLSDPSDIAPQQIITTKLRAVERCELRLDLQVTNNTAPVRLYWSGKNFSKTLLSRQFLSPTIEPAVVPETEAAFPPGVVLKSGTIISAPVKNATEASLHFQGALANGTLPLARVARINIRPLSAELAVVLPKGRAGVWLQNHDFIDGDLAAIENGKLTLGSVLFGRRSYDLAKDVVTIVLRNHETRAWRCSITARDGTILYGSAISVEPHGLSIADAPDFFIAPSQVIEVVRRNERNVDAIHRE